DTVARTMPPPPAGRGRTPIPGCRGGIDGRACTPLWQGRGQRPGSAPLRHLQHEREPGPFGIRGRVLELRAHRLDEPAGNRESHAASGEEVSPLALPLALLERLEELGLALDGDPAAGILDVVLDPSVRDPAH